VVGLCHRPFAEFLAGFDGAGNVLFTVDGKNGAAAPSCNWAINGNTYPCATAGGGNVVGPNPSVVGHVPTYNGTAGTPLADNG